MKLFVLALVALSLPAQIRQPASNIRFGSSLPSTCTASIGQVFFLTSASAGANVYGCTATNTWTVQGGSATIGGSIATGQICYGSASNTCAGSNNLFWDSATNRQGINTATPVTELQVSSTSTSSPRGIMSAQFNTGTDGARFHGRKARGTEAAPTVIVSGDNLARWVGSGYDGSNYLEDASIIFGTEGTIAATRVPTNIQFLTATDATPSVLTERMRITAAGNMGIGTTAPGYPLTVKALNIQTSIASTGAGYAVQRHENTSNTAYSGIEGSAGGVFFTGSAAHAAIFGSGAAFPTQFGSNGIIRQTIVSAGSVGIGTSNTIPTGTLHVKDNTASTGTTLLTVAKGAGDTADSTILSIDALMKFGGTNTTGAGSAALGANSPAVTNTAPYTWLKVISADGSTVYIPAWK